ncbi:MAG: FMN-binding protein, partial [Proteobacteria bacterium]|nr:FMN-binding protein [Pseudomonadota bacterium]
KEGKQVTDHDLDADGDTDNRDVKLARLAVRFNKDADGSSATPDILAVFVRKDGSDVGAYAIPLHGPGLWGPLSGYLAIDPNGNDVVGATFFAPKETPGLGSEICETKWEEMWKGKRIAQGQAIDVIKPGIPCTTAPEYCVDGISGATITSRGVDIMVEEAITKHYDEYLAGIRSGR